jgi:hypothetical protein
MSVTLRLCMIAALHVLQNTHAIRLLSVNPCACEWEVSRHLYSADLKKLVPLCMRMMDGASVQVALKHTLFLF